MPCSEEPLSQAAAPLAILLLAGSASAQLNISTVQSGLWQDPSTWDLGVPTSQNLVSISHPILFDRGGDRNFNVASLTLGADEDGSIIAFDNLTFTATDSIVIGQDESSGVLRGLDASVWADTISIGITGRGTVLLDGSDLEARATSGGSVPALRIGSTEELGIVQGEVRLRSSDGIEFGAQSIYAYEGLLQTQPFDFQRPVATTGGTDITFQPNSALDLTFASVFRENGAGVGSVLDFAIAPGGTINGTPSTISYPIGYTLTPVTSDPSRLGLMIDSTPTAVSWVTPGPGDWRDAANWSADEPLVQGNIVAIENNGVATLNGLVGPGVRLPLAQFFSLDVGGLSGSGAAAINNVNDVFFAEQVNIGSVGDVGSRPQSGTFTVDGSLSISTARQVRFGGTVDVGEPNVTGTADLTATGELVINDVANVTFNGDLDVGTARVSDASAFDGETIPADGTISTGFGTAILTNIDTVQITSDLDLADGNAEVAGTPAPVTVNQNVTFLADTIGSFIVNQVDLGTARISGNENENIVGDVTFSNITTIDIRNDFDFMRNGGSFPATGRIAYRMTANTTDVDLMRISGDIDMGNEVNIRGSNLLLIDQRWNITRSHVLVDSEDSAEIGNISLGGVLNPGPELTGATGNIIRSSVVMRESSFTTLGPTIFGRATEGAPTEGLSSEIILDEGSLGSSGRLQQGVGGTLVFQVGGIQRASKGALGPGTYSAWDVPSDPMLTGSAVELDGLVIAGINTVLPAGTHMFDFLRTTGSISGTPRFLVSGLPNGFYVRSFGITSDDGGTDNVLRLIVSDELPCSPADLFPAPTGDGTLNLADVQTFLIGFGQQSPEADLSPSPGAAFGGGDGLFNLSDVQTFLIAFGQGCP